MKRDTRNRVTPSPLLAAASAALTFHPAESNQTGTGNRHQQGCRTRVRHRMPRHNAGTCSLGDGRQKRHQNCPIQNTFHYLVFHFHNRSIFLVFPQYTPQYSLIVYTALLFSRNHANIEYFTCGNVNIYGTMHCIIKWWVMENPMCKFYRHARGRIHMSVKGVNCAIHTH